MITMQEGTNDNKDGLIILENTIQEMDDDGTVMSAYALYNGIPYEVHLNVFDPDTYETQAYNQVMRHLHGTDYVYEESGHVNNRHDRTNHVSNIMNLLRRYATPETEYMK
jgi:hypothetical protein